MSAGSLMITGTRLLRLLCPAVLLLGLGLTRAEAQPWLEETQLLDLRLGSPRSDLVAPVRYGGYELADGTPVSFERWYGSRWDDLTVMFLTPVARDLAITWGFSTGEWAEKYRIDPALRLGLIYQRKVAPRHKLTVSISTVIGGNLRERPCVADFGAIGGVQTVNCRLAASTLPPVDTLAFLFRERGFRESRIAISYRIRF